MIRINKITIIIAMAALSLASCSDSYLEPKPLSIYTPENTYVDYKSLVSALTACDETLQKYYNGHSAHIYTEMQSSDVAVNGGTDTRNTLQNYDVQVTPAMTMGKIKQFWADGYAGIKYANIVLNRMNNAKFDSQEQENQIRATAYFHRSFHYYLLTHQYGDVPWIDREYETPVTNFNTYDRWSILRQLEKDLEYAYKWMSDDVEIGHPTKGAAGTLLMKVLIENGKYDSAIEVGREVVARHPLMTHKFISVQDQHANLMLDLHSLEAKIDPQNTENLYTIVSLYQQEGSSRSEVMREATPFWVKIVDPDGIQNQQRADPKDARGPYDNNWNVGRGIAECRPTNYYQYEIWGSREKNDLRGPYNHDSWCWMTDLYYNNPKSKYHGQHLIRPNMTTGDSIRWWFNWPHYKLFVDDKDEALRSSDHKGGESPWYIFRSAETYLLMAEAYYWKGDLANCAAMLNVVRQRAGAEPLDASRVGMAEILNERARELYHEEYRHAELVRISYIYAKTGKPCEATGTIYSLDNFSGVSTVGNYNKQHGVNFFFDWVDTHNNFYNKIEYALNEYRLSTYHVLYPVDENAITANTGGTINQNAGYPQIQPNIKPLEIEDLQADDGGYREK